MALDDAVVPAAVDATDVVVALDTEDVLLFVDEPHAAIDKAIMPASTITAIFFAALFFIGKVLLSSYAVLFLYFTHAKPKILTISEGLLNVSEFLFPTRSDGLQPVRHCPGCPCPHLP